MYKIIVKAGSLCGCCCYPSNSGFNHISLEIKDLESNKVCSVSFSEKHAYAGTDGQIKTSYFPIISTVELYSNIDINLDDFKKELNRNFNTITAPCDPDVEIWRLRDFNYFCHNCADAGLFTLSYFFPVMDNKIVEATWQTYKLLTFPCCIATFGYFPFFGSPPLLNGPADIMTKSHILSIVYGNTNKVSLFPKTKTESGISDGISDAKTPASSPSRQQMF